MPRPAGLLAALFVLLAAAGCAEETAEIYEVRGRVVGPAFGGEALVVDHEEIPGYMEAMRMTLRLCEEGAAAVPDGTPVRFDLRVPERGAACIAALEPLPEGTPLQLADVPADTSTGAPAAAPDTSDVGG